MAAPAISRSLWGRGLAGDACAQHRVAKAAGGLSPRRSSAVGCPQLHSHPQAGADRGEVAAPCQSGCTISAAAPSVCPNRAHPAPISAGGTPDRRERSGGHRRGRGVQPRMEGQLPADTRPMLPPPSWCHPAAGSQQGDTADLGGHHRPGGCPGMGCCSLWARLRLEGRQGGGQGPGLSRQPAVIPQEPSRSVGPCRGWGFSQFSHAA